MQATPHSNHEKVGYGEDLEEFCDGGWFNLMVGRSEDGRVSQYVGILGGTVGLTHKFRSTANNHVKKINGTPLILVTDRRR